MTGKPIPETECVQDIRCLLRAVNIVARALSKKPVTMAEFDAAGDDYQRIRRKYLKGP